MDMPPEMQPGGEKAPEPGDSRDVASSADEAMLRSAEDIRDSRSRSGRHSCYTLHVTCCIVLVL